MSPPPQPVTGAKAPKPKTKNWFRRHPVLTAILAAFLLISIIGAAASGKDKTKTKSSDHGPTTPPAKPAVPQAESDARSWIRDHALDSGKVQANVELVQLQVGLLQKSATVSGVYKLAQYAQQAHDNIDAIRDDFASTTTDSGNLGNAELDAFSGANDLKNSMGALVAWTGDQNPAELASFTTQYQQARAEWNSGVRTIWRIAHRKNSPAI
jgi:hypothetical protein